MRRIAPVLVWVLAVAAGVVLEAAWARAGHAESVLVVVDGAAARDDAAWGQRAVRLATAFQAARHEVGMLVVARDAGRLQVRPREEPTAPWAAEAAAAQGAAAADIREVFRVALERHRVMRPLWLVTVGPFGGDTLAADPGELASLALATNRWNGTAPLNSRLFTVGLGTEGRARLVAHGAPTPSGWHDDGWLVLAAGPAHAIAKAWSPWDPDATGRVVSVEAPLEAVALGTAPPAEPPLALAPLPPAVRVLTSTTTGDVTLAWPLDEDAPPALAFAARPGDVWLVPVPAALAVPDMVLASDARLLGAAEDAPTGLAAGDVQADAPVEVTWRLQRTRVGPPPRWTVGDADGRPLPAGLEVLVGEERVVDAHVVEAVVRVRMTAAPGQPLAQAGRLRIEAGPPWPAFEVPYDVRVAPGRLRLEAVSAPAAIALPPAAADAALEVRLVRGNANAPSDARLVARTEPPGLAAHVLLELRAPGRATVRWSLEQPLEVPTGTALAFVPVLAADARPEDLVDGTLHLAPDALAGTDVEGAVERALVIRRPRLVREGTGPARYALVEGRVTAVEPLVVRLESEGLDGPWLVAWLAEAPEVEHPIHIGTPPPQAFRFVGDGPGRWVLQPDGPWRGRAARIFEASSETRSATPRDRAGRRLEEVRLEIEIRPRWGARGWLLVALAAMALLLVGLVLLALRPPPVTGTLLYAVEGMGGTVGRLDLAPVKRRHKEVRVDARGRLALDGPGRPLARIQAQRIGGVLTLVDAQGDGERRLLVDGLTWRTGRHALRYVSGRETTRDAAGDDDVPDLLGADFEMGTGRVRDAWHAAGGATDAVFGGLSTPDDDLDAAPPRSP